MQAAIQTTGSISNVVAVATLVLLFVGQAGALAAWILNREKAHEKNDTDKHEALWKAVGNAKTEHHRLKEEVEALKATVEAIPDRPMLDALFQRSEDRLDKRLAENHKAISEQISHLVSIIVADGNPLLPRHKPTDEE